MRPNAARDGRGAAYLAASSQYVNDGLAQRHHPAAPPRRTRLARPEGGAPGGSRTPDPRLRRPLLYPAELRARESRRSFVPAAEGSYGASVGPGPRPAELRAQVPFGKTGVSKGARTLNPRIHSPVLYRLSYTHRKYDLARPEGIEPPTCGFEGRRSIRLSYGRILLGNAAFSASRPSHAVKDRGGGIRTRDLLRPRQARYQAALRPGRWRRPEATPFPRTPVISLSPCWRQAPSRAIRSSQGRSFRNASPRCESASFSSGESSAIVRPSCASGTKRGS